MPEKNLHALLIAINNYPIPEHCLNGCINDLEAMKEYLQERSDADVYAVRFRELKNEEATRQQIIEAFDHFNEAKTGDVCLLFYSGHGSQMDAPEAFWPFEKDKLLETLVCYDSRINNGYDLADKELGYLIWKATQGRQVHFTAIMDCCHAGTNTRDLKIKRRMTDTNGNRKNIQQFLGYEQYNESSVLTIYKSDHVQIAAARSDQVAKELEISGKQWGVFTYSLLETLRQSNTLISYSDLLPPVALKVAYYVNDQYPQLDANGQANNNAIFLNGAIKPNNQDLLVNYDQKVGKWRLNAGALHGIIASTTDSTTTIAINESAKGTVKEVHASFSYLEGWDYEKKETVLPARILEMASNKLCIGFAPDCMEEARTNISALCQKNNNAFFKLEINLQKASYFIHTYHINKQPVLCLTKKESDLPVFQCTPDIDKAAATLFINHIATVAKWTHVCQLNNPVSNISSNDLDISLFRIEGEENPGDSAGEMVDYSQPVLFQYKWVNNKWVEPHFRLEVRNNTNKHFHVKALYLGNDFSICQLPLNAEAFGNLNRPVLWGCQPIQLVNVKAYSVGIPEINETIKLFVSTQDFYLNFFEQQGLEPERTRDTTLEKITQPPPVRGRSDWKAIHLNIRISRPVII
jgi:hypothetical protein